MLRKARLEDYHLIFLFHLNLQAQVYEINAASFRKVTKNAISGALYRSVATRGL